MRVCRCVRYIRVVHGKAWGLKEAGKKMLEEP